jgi:type IV pilus assembly protein PilM
MSNQILDVIIDKLALGNKSIIGIDIGSSMIKMIELEEYSGMNFKISKYASLVLAEGTIIDDEIQNEDELLNALLLCLKQLKSKRTNVCIGLSGPGTVMKKIQMPGELGPEEMQDQSEWDIEQYLPFKLEEANVSSSIIKENIGSLSDVFVGAAKKSLVNSYRAIVEKANLKVKIVDLNSAAILNVFELVLGSQVNSRGANWLLLEVGAVKLKFIVCKAGVLSFYKEINLGGNTITEEIQRALGVTHKEAESLKILGDGSGNIPEEVLEIINQVTTSLIAEISTARDFWLDASGESELSGCIVTGGGALIPSLNERLTEELGVVVEALNPFTKITYNKNNITDEMVHEIAYQGVCAIGLGMRRIPS